MTGQRASDLIIGIGNVLTHDDGVGVWASSMLSRLDLPDHIEVHDAGTVGLDATSLIEGRRKVVVLDALAADLEPGVICRMPAEELRPLVPATVSLHQVHLLDALDAAMLAGRPPFIGDTAVALMLAHVQERPPDIRGLVPIFLQPDIDTNGDNIGDSYSLCLSFSSVPATLAGFPVP